MSDIYASYRALPFWSEQTVRGLTSVIVGCGTLGAYLAERQAEMGVGHIVLVDDDTVQPHNVLRMALVTPADIGMPKVHAVAAGLRRRFPDQVRVTPLYGMVQSMLGLGRVRRADMVYLCADNRAARLYGCHMARLAGTPHLSGALERNTALVMGIFHPPVSGCYECTLTERERRALLPVRFSCTPAPEERAPSVPTTPMAANLCASWMTQLSLRYAHGESDTLAMRTLINPQHNMLQTGRFLARADCPCRTEVLEPEPVALAATRETVTAADLLREARLACGEDAMIVLDYELVTEERCLACGHRHERETPRHEAVAAPCPQCGAPMRATGSTCFLDAAHPLATLSLKELGLPLLHDVRVRGGKRTLTFELAGDADRLGWETQESVGC